MIRDSYPHTMKTILIILLISLSSCSALVPETTPEVNKEMPPEAATHLPSKVTEPQIIQDEKIVETSTPEYLQIQKDGGDLKFIKILSQTSIYTRYQISYTSEWFTISGILNIPKWEGIFPLIILNHGYIDPSVYTIGRGLKREQDYLASNGFAVLHTDYRNHAFSDYDVSLNSVWGVLRSKKYWADAINAILAVQTAKQNWVVEIQSIDTQNIWMLGHSMWGWVTMYSLVSQPKLIDAAILYAPVHSNEFYNFQRWTKTRFSTPEIQELNSLYGDTENSESFASISPETYFENISTPIQIYFGSNDESCPVARWYHIEESLIGSEKDIELIVYPGERHEFGPKWQNFMRSSVDFFNTHLYKE